MNQEQYGLYSSAPNRNDSVSITEVVDPQRERTLIWGYTLERNSFHVYVANGMLHRVIYDFKDNVIDSISGETLDTFLLKPSKRAYPEACELEFSLLMRLKGVELSFTTFNPERPASLFYGKRKEELNEQAV